MEHCRWAFLVSRFPQLTETFILREFLGLEARGMDFELHALIHQGAEHLQPAAVDLDARANYYSWASREAAAAHWHWIRHDPRAWLGIWALAVSASWRSRDAILRVPAVVTVGAMMARRMERQGIDRVHANWMTYPTLLAMVIRRLTGIPYSVTAHAHDIYGETGGLAPRVDGADAVFCCTRIGHATILERVGPDAAAKVEVIHHGLDVREYEFLGPPAPHDGPVRVLCVAAMLNYKGHRYLLDALRLLLDEGHRVELTLIGDGLERPAIEAQIERLGLGSEVRDLGRVPLEVVKEELARTDVFAQPSCVGAKGWIDGIPNVLVEALAVGRPVVATGLPGIRELVIDGETGVLTAEGDPRSIADGILRLADDPELVRRVVTQGRAKVEAEHDSSRTLDELHARMAALCAGTPRRAGSPD